MAAWRNLAIYLHHGSAIPFLWLVPAAAAVERQGDCWLIQAEKTWLAVFPMALDLRGVDPAMTGQVQFKDKSKGERRWPNAQVLSSRVKGGPFYGFALEIGEPQTHGTYQQFQEAIGKLASLDVGGIARGKVEYRASDGRRLAVDFGPPARVFRNGEVYAPDREGWLYAPASERDPVRIRQAWGGGELEVHAGQWHFQASVSRDGKARFTNSP